MVLPPKPPPISEAVTLILPKSMPVTAEGPQKIAPYVRKMFEALPINNRTVKVVLVHAMPREIQILSSLSVPRPFGSEQLLAFMFASAVAGKAVRGRPPLGFVGAACGVRACPRSCRA